MRELDGPCSSKRSQMHNRRLIVGIGAITVPAVWLGMLIGVSFVATPVKFEARSLDLLTALEIGQVTFSLFNKIEWGACSLLIAFIWMSRWPLIRTMLAAWVLFLITVQSACLLPVLNAYIENIPHGAQKPPSLEHSVYSAMETIKLVSLAAIAAMAISGNIRTSAPLR